MTHRYNYRLAKGRKIVNVGLDGCDALFVNSTTAFDPAFLKYQGSLQFRCAASFAGLSDTMTDTFGCPLARSTFEKHLADAVFLRARLEEQPWFPTASEIEIGNELPEEDLAFYLGACHKERLLPSKPASVREIVMDGNAKVLVKTTAEKATPRRGAPKRLRGRGGRILKQKAKPKPYGHGWFFALTQDALTVHVSDMEKPENDDHVAEAVRSCKERMKNIDLVVYDRSCRVRPSVREKFRGIRWAVDRLHQRGPT